MPSFDIVSEVNQVELKNAIDQTNKEISNRFDFKGSDARVELADKALTVFADDEFKIAQVYDVLIAKMAKRNVDVRALQRAKSEKIGGDKMQGDAVRISGAKRDDLQQVITMMKKNVTDYPLQFANFRD